MKHRRFHEGEEVRVGPQASDCRMRGRVCRIEGLLRPIAGEHRYLVITPSGMSSVVLEASLQKLLARWEDCEWQPRRVR